MADVKVKVLSNNVKRMLQNFKNDTTTNHMDIEEDYEFLNCNDRKEFWALVAWCVKNDNTIKI